MDLVKSVLKFFNRLILVGLKIIFIGITLFITKDWVFFFKRVDSFLCSVPILNILYYVFRFFLIFIVFFPAYIVFCIFYGTVFGTIHLYFTTFFKIFDLIKYSFFNVVLFILFFFSYFFRLFRFFLTFLKSFFFFIDFLFRFSRLSKGDRIKLRTSFRFLVKDLSTKFHDRQFGSASPDKIISMILKSQKKRENYFLVDLNLRDSLTMSQRHEAFFRKFTRSRSSFIYSCQYYQPIKVFRNLQVYYHVDQFISNSLSRSDYDKSLIKNLGLSLEDDFDSKFGFYKRHFMVYIMGFKLDYALKYYYTLFSAKASYDRNFFNAVCRTIVMRKLYEPEWFGMKLARSQGSRNLLRYDYSVIDSNFLTPRGRNSDFKRKIIRSITKFDGGLTYMGKNFSNFYANIDNFRLFHYSMFLDDIDWSKYYIDNNNLYNRGLQMYWFMQLIFSPQYILRKLRNVIPFFLLVFFSSTFALIYLMVVRPILTLIRVLYSKLRSYYENRLSPLLFYHIGIYGNPPWRIAIDIYLYIRQFIKNCLRSILIVFLRVYNFIMLPIDFFVYMTRYFKFDRFERSIDERSRFLWDRYFKRKNKKNS